MKIRFNSPATLLVTLAAAQGFLLSPVALAVNDAAYSIRGDSNIVAWYNTDYSYTGNVIEVLPTGNMLYSVNTGGMLTSNDGYFLRNAGRWKDLNNSGVLRAYSSAQNSAGITAVIFNDRGVMNAINNTGTILGYYAYGVENSGTLGTINNTSTGVISGYYAVSNNGSISLLNNAGNLAGSYTAINNNGVIDSLTNSGSIVSSSGYAIGNNGTINSLSNSGVLSNNFFSVINNGTITSLTNSGTISDLLTGVYNTGEIGTLTNTGTLSSRNLVLGNTRYIGEIVNSGVIAGVIDNTSAHSLTFSGGEERFGLLTGSAGNIGTLSSAASDVVFNTGRLQLNDNIVATDYNVINNAATLLITNPITIHGNYVQSSAATLLLGVSDSAIADGNATTDSGYGRLIVSGSASVAAGSAISLMRTGSSYNFAAGQRYVVIDAASNGTDYHSSQLNYQATGYSGGVRGSTVTADGRSALVVSLTDTPVIPVTPVTPGDSGGVTPQKPPHRASHGNAISSLNGLANYSGIRDGILDLYNASLAIDSQDEANRVGERLASTQNINAASATAAASDAAFAVVGNHINAQRSPQTSGVATGESDDSWTLWGQPFGGFARRGASSEASGYRAKFGGLLLGADRALGDNWRSGAAVTYSNTSVHGQDNLSGNNSTASNYGMIGYAGYNDDPWFVNLSAGVARQSYNTLRQVSFTGYQDSAHGAFSGHSVTLQSEVGYPLALAHDTVLTPLASLAWSYQHLSGYQESSSNGMGLTVDAAHSQSLTSDIGARLEKSIATGLGNLTPYLQLSWIHQYDNRQMSSEASYSADTLGETRFTTKGAAPVKDMAGVAFGSTLYQANDVSLDARYDLQRGEQYQAHTFSLRLSKQF